MMDDFMPTKIEVIYRLHDDDLCVDDFFSDPLEALTLVADVLSKDGHIMFLALPTLKCFDYDRKEIYYS